VIRASTPALAAACLFLVPACGARSELEAPGEGATSARPPPQCSGWQPAGPLVTVSEPEAAEVDDDLMSMIPSAGGALLAWIALADPSTPTSTWRTLALGFDAAPRSPIEAHLSFPTTDGGVGISLAANGSSFAALVADSATGGGGCRFLPLDEDGMAVGPAVSVDGWSEACDELAPTPDGFSFIASDYVGAGSFALLNLDAKGSVLSRTPLPAPPETFEDGWLALHDRSFLLATTDVDGVATSVQRFSPGGAPLADAAVITAGGPYLMPMVKTSAGVLSAWDAAPGSFEVRLLDEDGSPVAAALPIAGGGNYPILDSVLAPTPAGDALLAWTQIADATAGVEFFVMALGPDGAPRGAPTSLGTFEALGALEAVVSPDGRGALLAVSAVQAGPRYRVLALPLACVP
jgi:hypothetical protein